MGAVGILFLPGLSTGELAAQEKAGSEFVARIDQLPTPVARMHREILRAARSGEIENMREVLQLSELMPLINGKFVHDPVKLWKSSSADKGGREILALLSEILELPPGKMNNKSGSSYVWPYFAGKALRELSARQLVQLYRLAPALSIAQMLNKNRYFGATLTIGADGTWHSFDYALASTCVQKGQKEAINP